MLFMPARINSRTAPRADAVIFRLRLGRRFSFFRDDLALDLLAVPLLLGARRAPAAVTARRGARCFFVFGLAAKRSL
jgi:hypothetical protein